MLFPFRTQMYQIMHCALNHDYFLQHSTSSTSSHSFIVATHYVHLSTVIINRFQFFLFVILYLSYSLSAPIHASRSPIYRFRFMLIASKDYSYPSKHPTQNLLNPILISSTTRTSTNAVYRFPRSAAQKNICLLRLGLFTNTPIYLSIYAWSWVHFP